MKLISGRITIETHAGCDAVTFVLGDKDRVVVVPTSRASIAMLERMAKENAEATAVAVAR